MKDVTISSSSRFYEKVNAIKEELEACGISVFTPDLDFNETEVSVDAAKKHELTSRFLEKIKNSKCLLIVTDESGYVGRSVSLEAGYAHGLGHPIFCLLPISEPAVAYLCKHVKSLDEIASALEDKGRE